MENLMPESQSIAFGLMTRGKNIDSNNCLSSGPKTVDRLERKEKIAMTNYVRKCPTCGGEVVEKEVTEILSGGINTAFVAVKVGVCLHCGERLYTPDTVRKFEEIEAKLQRQDTSGFRPL